jgi:hypothetical protein
MKSIIGDHQPFLRLLLIILIDFDLFATEHQCGGPPISAKLVDYGISHLLLHGLPPATSATLIPSEPEYAAKFLLMHVQTRLQLGFLQGPADLLGCLLVKLIF